MIGGHTSGGCLNLMHIVRATLSDGGSSSSEVKTFKVMMAFWRRGIVVVKKQEEGEEDAED